MAKIDEVASAPEPRGPHWSGKCRMKRNVIAAIVLGICLIAAAFLYAGRYYFIRVDKCTVAKADRFTGEVERVSDVECKIGF